MMPLLGTLRKYILTSLLAFLIVWYFLATLPYLEDFPLMDWAQPMIAAPAYKLVTSGIYGSDMFTGFYSADEHNYDHMPLYPLLVGFSFKLLGFGIVPARLVSVLSGFAVLLLTFNLGRQLYNPTLGLLAAFSLCFVRLGVPNANDVLFMGYQINMSGMSLLDFARVIRFDVLVPAFVLAACSSFYAGRQRGSWVFDFLSGIFVGLATLTHLYGAFILPVLVLLLLCEFRRRLLRQTSLYLLLAGFFLVLVPYVIYVAQDFGDFRGQMLRHEYRFEILNPSFYISSFVHEPSRFLSWFGGSFRQPFLFPRVGIWVLSVAFIVTNLVLLARWRRGQLTSPDRLLLLALPVIEIQFALIINLKRYPYVSILLPFLALEIAFAIATLLAPTRPMWFRAAVVLAILATLSEGVYGLNSSIQAARAATDYGTMEKNLRALVPPGSRVLLSQPHWFGFYDYDVRSINLIFILTDSVYGYVNPPTVEQVVRSINPAYIIVEERLLKTYEFNPASLPNDKIANRWRAFDEYIQRDCPRVVAEYPALDYGLVKVFRCNG